MSRLIRGLGIALAALLLAWVPQAQARFMQFFSIIQMGGPTFQAGDEAKWAKYDIVDFARNRWNQIIKNGVYTYDLIRALNPNESIFIYEQGPDTWTGWGNDRGFDYCSVLDMNNIARIYVSRGHSMGALDPNQPQFFLLTSGGARCHTYGAAYRYLLDFGSPSLINYWGEATVADLGLTNAWHGDGIFIDNCAPLQAGYDCDTPAKYNTDATWSAAMMTWHTGLAAYLRANGLKSWTNSGNLAQAAGYTFYTQIDSNPNAPDVMTDEGVFVHGMGTASATFYAEDKWKRQVDIMTVMQHVKLAQFASVNLAEGATGTDNNNQPYNYYDALWYALGSFCLGMNDVLKNDYLYFQSYQASQKAYWYDEYDRIDLGAALGPYTVQTISGIHVYSREFQKGYVFVNLSAATTVPITLAQACKQLTHATINQDPSTFADVTSISLPGHRAAFLLKSAPTPTGTVVGRYVFYNNSAFDGNDANANAADDGAIATNKSALLPGHTATAANYTSYGRGINGIMVDISGLTGTPTAADFSFKVGNNGTPSGWATAPAPTSVTVRAGAGVGGSSRVTILWADGAIAGKWLQVTTLGTASQDVFYFGNAIGDTCNSTGDAQVTPADVTAIRNNAHTMALSPAAITDAWDINRDKKVSPTDEILCRNYGTNSSTALNLIAVP